MGKKFRNEIVKSGKPFDSKKMERSLSWMRHLVEERKRICELFRDKLDKVEYCPVCSCKLNTVRKGHRCNPFQLDNKYILVR